MHTAALLYPEGNIMKSLIITSILTVGSLAAFADSGNGETYGHNLPVLENSLSRGEVIADAREAIDKGLIAYGEFSGPFQSDSESPLSTAEIAMELQTALHEGTIKHGDIENPSRHHH
jgi:hypothetical protein